VLLVGNKTSLIQVSASEHQTHIEPIPLQCFCSKQSFLQPVLIPSKEQQRQFPEEQGHILVMAERS
jgi:hypothetical protein